MPKQALNQFGRAADFDLLEGDAQEFMTRCRHHSSSQFTLSAPVSAMIQLAKQRAAPFYIIEMPMTARHRTVYYTSPAWLTYRRKLVERVVKEGGHYVNASDWIDEAGFSDALHLNQTGAKNFSVRLRTHVSNLR